MKVLLIDIDSKIPNFALKKIEKFFKDKGDEVTWNNELFAVCADRIFVSCIFNWNKKKAREFERYNNVLIGGSGYDLKNTLPIDIDIVKPRINLGFTTRGCIRKCPFCIVWQKEPIFKREADINDIWDKKSRDIVLLDNNILVDLEWFFHNTAILKKEKLRVDFNQGLDCRLLTDDIVKELKSLSHIEYRFAFDDIKLQPQVEKAITLLKKYKINRCNWYVLVGFNSTLKEDFERLNYLRSRKQNAFVQRYEICKGKKEYILMARWVNQHHIFQTHTYEEFCKKDLNYHPRDYKFYPTPKIV